LKTFTPLQKIEIVLMSLAGWMVLRLIGSTLRYRVEGWERVMYFKERKEPFIGSFWHNQVFCAVHFWRSQNIAVMISRHFDGEIIARVIGKLGFIPARGSSSRGAVQVLLEAKHKLQQGLTLGVTSDGPRGPRYQVKPGPVWLSRQTGVPILPFHIQPKWFWSLKSWDRFQIPMPFTRVLVKFGRPLIVSSQEDQESWVIRHQEELDRIGEYSQAYWEGGQPAGDRPETSGP
jgi:lysophospholipid acyltransferase (LPLAT)-like uncharacterized protein